ncbi:MAG: hypothetical protein WKG00_18255 [Polyangiaceae bacterium]
MATNRPTPLEVIRIAATAPADPRTVRKALEGRASEMATARVERAVRELSLERLLTR